MKIKIINVETGAEFDDIIWNYWVEAELPNHKCIRLFDSKAINLTEFKGTYVNADLKALFIQKDFDENLLQIIGRIVNQKDKYFLEDNLGTYIELNSSDIKEGNIPINEEGEFFLGRLDIESIIFEEPSTT